MSGDRRMPLEDDSRFADERSRDCGVRPIGDVLAELLDQYRVRFPNINVQAVRLVLSSVGSLIWAAGLGKAQGESRTLG